MRPYSVSPLLALALLVFCTLGCRSREGSKGLVDEAAATAKANGQSVAIMDRPIIELRGIRTYDEEARSSYIVRVKALGLAMDVLPTRRGIETWYKFSVVEDLSRKPLPSETGEGDDGDIPQSLLPLSPNEIVVPFPGGEAIVDGVLVKYGNRQPIFNAGHEYLLILRRADPSRPIYTLLSGDTEAGFSISGDGDTLNPIDPKSNSRLQRDINQRFHGSMKMLRTEKAGHP
jgi:hypothetical protein